MTDPKQPDDHPTSVDTATMPANAPNGVPAENVDMEPKARPTSDRQLTETAASPERHTPD